MKGVFLCDVCSFEKSRGLFCKMTLKQKSSFFDIYGFCDNHFDECNRKILCDIPKALLQNRQYSFADCHYWIPESCPGEMWSAARLVNSTVGRHLAVDLTIALT